MKGFFKGRELIGVEVGTYDGENAEYMFENLNIKKLYLIDPYEEYPDYLISEKHQNQKRLSQVKEIAEKRLRKYKDKIIWIRKYSDDAIKNIPENVDFVYIDGNHEYEYARRDMSNYYKQVKSGGILAGHDIYGQGVSKAFCEFISKINVQPHINSMDWWIIKK
jgi:hypothetical protein